MKPARTERLVTFSCLHCRSVALAAAVWRSGVPRNVLDLAASENALPRTALLLVPVLISHYDVMGVFGPLPMDDALRAKILKILESQHLMTIATIRPDGYPQATLVNYVHQDLIIYFATDATSQKTANLSLNNKVSATIASETENYNKLRGLSLSGIASRLLDKDSRKESIIRLFQALPQSRRYVPDNVDQLAVFSITPVAISLVDYSEGFGKSYLIEL